MPLPELPISDRTCENCAAPRSIDPEMTPESISHEDLAAVLAFLDERHLMVDVFREALDLMVFLEKYWQACTTIGVSPWQVAVTQGKLFAAFHKSRLKKRILEVRDKLDRTEAEYMRTMQKSKRN